MKLYKPPILRITVFTVIILMFLRTTSYAQRARSVAGTPTISAQSSGLWSSPNTWGGLLPKNDDRVLIPNGIQVTIASKISEEFKSVVIDNGATLSFATGSSTELRTEYLYSAMNGVLEIGKIGSPIEVNNKASLVFAERGGTTVAIDPDRFAPGAILMGPTTMHGSAKTSWLTLAHPVLKGEGQLQVNGIPSGWKVGDKLVIAGTTPITNASIQKTDEIASDEVVTITEINGPKISFSPSLQRDHRPPKEAPSLEVHIANLTRNIVVSSENPSVTSISGAYRKPRGHLMFMHNLRVDLRYMSTHNLGRTDKSILVDDWDFTDLNAAANTGKALTDGGKNPRGRYSIHFHRGGLDTSVFPAKPIFPLPTPAHVEGCVVNSDPGWAYVNHSARVHFIQNVSYNVVGGAFNTEAGNETGSFIKNIAIRTINPENPIMIAPRPRDSYMSGGPTSSLADIREHRQDFAWQGDGFWLHSTGVTVEGNVVSGATGHAYVYWLDGLIEKKLGAARGSIDAHVPAAEFPKQHASLKKWKEKYPNFVLDIWYLQPRPFKNNIAYNFARGVQTYYVHTELHRKTDPTVTDPNSWMNDLPDDYKDQLDLVLDGTQLWNIGKVGFETTTSANITIQNSRVVGYGGRTGIENYGTNPNPNYVHDEPEVIGMDLDYFQNTHRWTLRNNTIEGFSGKSIGLVLPKNGQVTVDGGKFNNSGIDIFIGCPSKHLSNENDGFGIGMLSEKPTKSSVLLTGNISFQNANNNIVMDAELIYDEVPGKGFPMISGAKLDPLFFFAPQEVTFNFGEFSNVRAYFDEQDANYTPLNSGTNGNACAFSDRAACVDANYVDKTNSELKAAFNKSFLGAITPNTAIRTPVLIGGKVATTSLSTSDVNDAPPFKIFPNPSAGIGHIISKLSHYRLEIFGLDGKLLQQFSSSEKKSTIDFSNLAPGVYFIKIIDRDKRHLGTKKIIKSVY